jgi:hypothetical protein
MTHPKADDIAAIHELYARYSWALDTGDTEAYMAMFTQDAETAEEQGEGMEVRRGLAAIRERILQYHDNPDFAGPQHQMAQLTFSPDPLGRADHWQVRCYAWSTMNRPPAPPQIYWCGHICDIVAKVGGNWLFKSKEIHGWSGAVLERFGKAGQPVV